MWKDIETAPKDGKEVLLCRGSQIVIGWFGEDWHMEGKKEWLYGTGDDFSTGYYFTPIKPTHWQPLPELPTKETNNFRIDSVGFYRNRKGEKVEIVARSKSSPNVWLTANGGWYRNNEIVGKWEEPQINSDNSKVNANALERIEELESALRYYADEKIYNISKNGILSDAGYIAKKALGETK